MRISMNLNLLVMIARYISGIVSDTVLRPIQGDRMNAIVITLQGMIMPMLMSIM